MPIWQFFIVAIDKRLYDVARLGDKRRTYL